MYLFAHRMTNAANLTAKLDRRFSRVKFSGNHFIVPRFSDEGSRRNVTTYPPIIHKRTRAFEQKRNFNSDSDR